MMEQMEALKQSIREKGKMVVAFSGGVDSTFLLKVAHDVLGSPRRPTSSALLRCVTVAGVSRPMKEPYFVLATQNPVEQEGTYPLPEAQLDR